jgi:hypothetical protein
MSLDWVYEFITEALPGYPGANVFRAKQSYAIPETAFITYQILSMDVSAFEKKISDSDLYADPPDDPEDPPDEPILGTFDRTFQQNCALRIQVDCYSPAGLTDIQTLVSCARSDDYMRIFDGAHIAFIDAGAIRDLSFLGDNDYRDRWSVDMNFLVALTRVEQKNAILEWIAGVETDVIDTVINA